MQSNLEDFFFCENSTGSYSAHSYHVPQYVSSDRNLSNPINHSDHNTYREMQNFYMDQFNQSYAGNMCVTSTSDSMICERNTYYAYNQNYTDLNNCSPHQEFWNTKNYQRTTEIQSLKGIERQGK